MRFSARLGRLWIGHRGFDFKHWQPPPCGRDGTVPARAESAPRLPSCPARMWCSLCSSRCLSQHEFDLLDDGSFVGLCTVADEMYQRAVVLVVQFQPTLDRGLEPLVLAVLFHGDDI